MENERSFKFRFSASAGCVLFDEAVRETALSDWLDSVTIELYNTVLE